MNTEWKYQGDINLKYGGMYYRFDMDYKDFPYYAEVVRITDLESACGADGLVLIERLDVCRFNDKKAVHDSLSCIGLTTKDLIGMDRMEILSILLEAFIAYGHYDYDDNPIIVVHDYSVFSTKHSWDGWKPDKEQTQVLHRQHNNNLREYVVAML